MTGIINEQKMEKQIDKHMGGCMAGLFNLFDRGNVLSGRRLYAKRLPASISAESVSGSASSVGSPALSREFARPTAPATPPPAAVPDAPAKSPVAVSSPELKEGVKSPWKFSREAPRLSLDSRLHPRGIRTSPAAAASGGVRCDGSIGSSCDDESENQRRSPSVVARLMGLDAIPSSQYSGSGSPEKVELRRSMSESRSRDMLHQSFYPASDNKEVSKNGRDTSNGNADSFSGRLSGRGFNHGGYTSRAANPEPATKPRKVIGQQQQRKGLYDFGDFFPEIKPAASSISADVEKRLKMRGIDEPSKDLETLKHILEALQLKGLLHHSKSSTAQIPRRNFLYERQFPYDESPIKVMKPARSPRRPTADSSPPRFQSKPNLSARGGDSLSSPSPRRDPSEMVRNPRSPMRNPSPGSPGRSENRSLSPSTARRKVPSNVETRRRANEGTTMESRRVSSPVQSPRMGSRRSDQTAGQSPRRRRSTAEIRSGRAEDASSTVSESSRSTASHTDTEKLKTEEYYKEGKSLLDRCDKLLHSIAEMTSTSSTSAESQLSPVSVLDSSFCREESSPSPVMKRTIHFKDRVVDQEDELWSTSSSGGSFKLKSSETDDFTDDQQDADYAYVSEIIRASNFLPYETDIFLLLEKQQAAKGRDTSRSSKIHRRLIFDTTNEILDRNRQLPPWKSASGPHIREIWSQLQTIQKRDESEDLFEIICGVMKRDLSQDSVNGWGEHPSEISEAALDIERLIFKDLIGETIAAFAGESNVGSVPRRKLVF